MSTLVNQATSWPAKPTGYLRIMLIGDVVGEPGLEMCAKWLPRLKTQFECDGVLVNGENSAKDGRGITPQTFNSLLNAGADVITTGNHVWRHQEIYPILENSDQIVRPANFPAGAPGKGFTIIKIANKTVGIINLMGRVFFKEHTNCPFLAAQQIIAEIKPKTDLIIVDFHAEATSEKAALAHFLDGKVSAVVGTHSHVQTADARILPGGTAFMTDLGCVAALNSCIGVEKQIIIDHMLSQLPNKFKVAKNLPMALSGAIVDLDVASGKALEIAMLRIQD